MTKSVKACQKAKIQFKTAGSLQSIQLNLLADENSRELQAGKK